MHSTVGEEPAVICDEVDLTYVETAPYRFVARSVLPVSPERLFDVWQSPEAWKKWVPVIKEVRWTSPLPPEVGSTRTVDMRGGISADEVFLAWTVGERMAFRFTEFSGSGISAFAEDYRVSDLGLGQSKVEWTMAMTPIGPSAKAFPLLRFAMGGGLNLTLRNLKRYLNSKEFKTNGI
ncbi:MAG TPA: SRPBCC family protein [Acidimicrobiaceae bacterium]|nr:SRPBCC family protein [Acidimicrobiaceae bacterium]